MSFLALDSSLNEPIITSKFEDLIATLIFGLDGDTLFIFMLLSSTIVVLFFIVSSWIEIGSIFLIGELKFIWVGVSVFF